MKKVCVFGTYRNLGEKEKNDIIKLGRLLASGGAAVVCGGFGGSMEYISKGAASSGGRTIGVTYYRKGEKGGKKANRYIKREIETRNIFRRIKTMMDISDGFIVLQGGTGTLLEIAAILEHINKGMMRPKPLVAVGPYWKKLMDGLRGEDVLSKEAKIILKADNVGDLVIFVRGVDEAASEILRRI